MLAEPGDRIAQCAHEACLGRGMIRRHRRHLPLHRLPEIAQLRFQLREALVVLALDFAEEQDADLVDFLAIGILFDGRDGI